MSKFNINDFILENTQYELLDGFFKPLENNKGLFIKNDKVINILWFITSQGLLKLIINNELKYFYLIDKKNDHFDVYEIYPIDNTGKFKKGEKIIINIIEYEEYKINKDYFYFKNKLKTNFIYISIFFIFHILFFSLIIFIFNLDINNKFIQLFFIVSYIPMISFYKSIILKLKYIFNT